MDNYLERVKERVEAKQAELADMQSLLGLLKRESEAAESMRADRDRLYRLIDEKGYRGAYAAVHGTEQDDTGQDRWYVAWEKWRDAAQVGTNLMDAFRAGYKAGEDPTQEEAE